MECTPDNPCVIMQLHTQETKNQRERIDKMEVIIEKLRNRLPLWATGAFTGAGLAIGSLSTLLLAKH